VRSALLWALRRLRAERDFLVSIETIDDVAFESIGGDATDLLQTKHHQKGIGSLTDASPDLWKTLRIWVVGYESGQIPSTVNLYLITTGIAPYGTAASRLRSTSRDVMAAQQALDVTAASSTNQANKRAYEAYLKATPNARTEILERIVVIDAAPSVGDLDGELRQEVYWAADKEHHDAFLERLEGWWLRRVLGQLTGGILSRIGSVEIECQMSDLREQFKQESLPIDDDLLEFSLDEATRSAHENSTFVRQLELIKAGKRRIAAAIRDYYRAFEQRSRWLRDDLVIGMDLHKYEKRLSEEWELVFDAMRDDLGEKAAEGAKELAARSVLQWAERTTLAIRPSVTEPFVSRGSLHMLSDEARIGWHPDFKDRLAMVLSSRGGTK
jgi:hypothetical protein